MTIRAKLKHLARFALDAVSDPVSEKDHAETYQIWKNGELVVSFCKGYLPRADIIFDYKTVKQEFDSCVAYWTNQGVEAIWELRIRKSTIQKAETYQNQPRSKDSLSHTVEATRKAHSPDSAYQHMLDTIANDIDREFCRKRVCSFRVSNFVRRWNP